MENSTAITQQQYQQLLQHQQQQIQQQQQQFSPQTVIDDETASNSTHDSINKVSNFNANQSVLQNCQVSEFGNANAMGQQSLNSDCDKRLLISQNQNNIDPLKIQQNIQLVSQPRLNLSMKDFQIIRLVGTGTFGKVYHAKKDEREYAIKVLKKSRVLELNQIDHVMSEKNILMSISHPFIVKLYGSFQDKDRLYLAFEFIRGGEIFRLLRSERMFPNDVTLFYITETLLAIEYLHSLQIAYRDLKPENLLIASDGHIKITDFGFAKKLVDRTFTLCGTPEYLAPEIIMSMGHNQGVDWWALGIILFEMLAGYPPFYDHNPYEIYKKIAYGHYQFPGHISLCARHLIAGLLERDISRRLGCMSNGATDIKNHPWFNGVVWDKVYRKEIEAPWIPETQEDYFDRYPDSGDINLMPIRDEYQVFFKDF